MPLGHETSRLLEGAGWRPSGTAEESANLLELQVGLLLNGRLAKENFIQERKKGRMACYDLDSG